MKIEWEQWLEVLRILKGDSFTRLCGVAVVIGGGVLGGWVPQAIAAVAKQVLGIDVSIQNADPLYGLIIIIVALAAATIYVMRKQQKTIPHPNDVKLLEKFRALISYDLLKFLRNHSFRNPTRRQVFDSLEILTDDWDGARFSFEDKEMNRKLQDLRKSAQELLGITGARLFLDHRDNTCSIMTPLTDQDVTVGISNETLAGIEAMNKSAAALCASVPAMT